MRVLVAGWFSFEEMGTTAGDVMACNLVREWLAEIGVTHDVAFATSLPSGVDWRTVCPELYSHLIFVCGPFGNGPPVDTMLRRFSGCRLVGVNLSMLDPVETWNPFDVLIERDSSRAARPDITFAAHRRRVPVVGVVLVHRQREYGKRARHDEADAAIERLLAQREVARCQIDTQLDRNAAGLRTSCEIDSLIARMDAVVTTRLHGLVLALRNGVPALAVDAISGGAKVLRQADTIGWPAILPVDHLSDDRLARVFDWCLTTEARAKARRCGAYGRARVEATKDTLLRALREVAPA